MLTSYDRQVKGMETASFGVDAHLTNGKVQDQEWLEPQDPDQ